jgi:hypothetical protein
MRKSGTIYEDGSISLDGYAAEKRRLLALTDHLMAYHCPGGYWSDNGGRHYGPATVEVGTLEDLRAGNKKGTWRFTLKLFGPSLSFHPQPSEACRLIANKLPTVGPVIASRIKDRNDRCELM